MAQPIILFLLKALEGRGAERMVTTLAHTYLEMGGQVHVLCLEPTDDMPLDPRVSHHVIDYDQPKFAQIDDLQYKYQLIAAEIDEYVWSEIGQPDLILANIYKVNWIMSYSRLSNVINVIHTAVSRQFATQLAKDPQQMITHLKKVYGAHPCSGVSQGAVADLQALIGDITPMTTIYNPCDVDAIQKAGLIPVEWQSYGIVPKRYLIHVGSFDGMKGHRDLLLAYSKTDRQLPLVLLGKGNLEEEIKQLAKQLSIDSNVKFLGFHANPYPFIKHATALVLASKFEGFGYVIVEAQALNVPVVSTDCPFGPRELLPSDNLVAVGDHEALTMILYEVMKSPGRYLTSVNPTLSPQRIAKEYLQFAKLCEP